MICYELTVRSNSHFSQEASFYRLNSLVDLVIGDHCVSRNNNFMFTETMPSLQSIKIGSDSFCSSNENGSFFIDKQPMLQSIIIGNRSFTSYTNFRVLNCPKLKVLQIGEDSNEKNDWLLSYNQYSRCFQNALLFELQRNLFWVHFDQRCPN